MLPFVLAAADEFPKNWYTPAIWPVGFSLLGLFLYSQYVQRVTEHVPVKFRFYWAIPLVIAFIQAAWFAKNLTDPFFRDIWNGGKKGKIIVAVSPLLPIITAGIILYYDKKILPNKLKLTD